MRYVLGGVFRLTVYGWCAGSGGMLTEQERAKLSTLDIWQYPEVPVGFRRVVLFLRHAGERITSEVLVETARSLHFDAESQMTVEFRGIETGEDLAALAEATRIFDNELPGRVLFRVTLGRGALELVPAIRNCQLCIDFGDEVPPAQLPSARVPSEALIRITPTNQDQVPGWIGPLFQAGFNPIAAEVDHSLEWTGADMEKLEGTLIRLEGVSSYFRDAGLRLLDREWVCRGSKGPHCGVGTETVAIAPDGLEFACPRFVGHDPTQAIGHVQDSLWITMWKRYGDYYPSQNRECGGYPVEHQCLGGCAFLNLKKNGDLLNGVSTQCRERRWRMEIYKLL